MDIDAEFEQDANDKALNNILQSLNKQQLLATKFDPTRCLQVIAGPGTGKTKVLTSRVAYLLLRHKINPADIIVTTFTNKAAKEMIERLNLIMKGTAINLSDLLIGTFHGICLRILLRFGDKIGLIHGWRIVEEREIDTAINEMIEKVPDQVRDYANSFQRKINLCRPQKNGEGWVINAKMIKKEISRLKSHAILPEEYEKESEHDSALSYFYNKYQEKLHELNALDFDDLLMYCFRLLTKERCLPFIKHVFVDEFQDTNSIQMDLMFMMAKGNHHISRGITVVGDPDQSIYAFRNALDLNFQEMANKSPLPCSQIVLVENYRSTQKILDTSETLIKQQVKGRALRSPLHAQFDCNLPPVYVDFPVLFLQAPSLVRELLYLKALPKLFTFDDFAILVRQRRQIKSIETALIEHRIPYKIIRGRAFWELKEIGAMLNLMRCVISDNDRASILQSLIYPSRGLGQATLEKIKIKMDELQKFDSPLNVLRKIASNEISFSLTNKIRSVITSFLKMIDSCKSNMKEKFTETLLDDLFSKLYKESGLENEYLYKDDKHERKVTTESKQDPNYENARHKNIIVLKKYFLGTKQIEDINIKSGDQEGNFNQSEEMQLDKGMSMNNYVTNFFNSLSIFSSDNEGLEKTGINNQGQVTISTIHGSKGLEWPVVFIPGCVEGIIPSIFPKDEEDDIEDEDDDDMDDDEKGDKGNSSTDTATKRPKSVESTLDEERRMFFVAQTRAKVLLYLSSVKEDEKHSISGGPSRFLTAELLATMVDDQKAFADIKNIKSLYQAVGRPLPRNISNKFSFRVLLNDYASFIENRREKIFWGGRSISNVQTIELETNIIDGNGSGMSQFTTAADQLRLDTQFKPPPKQYAPSYRPSKRSLPKDIPLSPQKSFAPTTNIRRSPSPKRQYAPQNDNQNIISPSKSRLIKRDPVLSDNNTPLFPLKKEDSFEYLKSVKIEDTTASEILHNPNDSIVDNRPIIASAKTLADAITARKGKKRINKIKEELTDMIIEEAGDNVLKKKAIPKISSKEKDKGKTKGNLKTTIKKEIPASQFDIFSQLSRAKKKTKTKENEIIIIDD